MENTTGSQNVMMAGPVDGALRDSPSLQTLNLDLKKQIASFMSVATCLKIATLSRCMNSCPGFRRSEIVLSLPRPPMENGRVDGSAISWRSLLGLLSRGGGAYTKVTLKGAYMLGIERAWRREHGVPLIYPMGDFETSTAITSLRQLLQEGPLSSLRTLEVMKGRIDQGRVDLGGIFLRAVGISGCPVLEELLLHNLSYSPDLPAIVEMLVRRGPPCAPLKRLELYFDQFDTFRGHDLDVVGELEAIIQAPCLGHLESLALQTESGAFIAAAYLQGLAKPSKLKSLSVEESPERHDDFDFGYDGGSESIADELAFELAQGKAPLLEKLSLLGHPISLEPMEALCESIQERGTFSHMQELHTFYCLTGTNIGRFMAALCTGCPALTKMVVSEDGVMGALSAAMHASPSALSSLTELWLEDTHASEADVVELCQALSRRSSKLQDLMMRCMDPSLTANVAHGFIGLLAECPNLESFTLTVGHRGESMGHLLAAAIAPGGIAHVATRQLRELQFDHLTRLDVAHLMESLVAGACPRLQRLHVGDYSSNEAPPEWAYVEQQALVALLTGQAPCSATLTELSFIRRIWLDSTHTTALAEGLRDHAALPLRNVSGLVCGGGFDACLDLVRVMSMASSAWNLRNLYMQFSQLTREEIVAIGNELARLIDEGAWPWWEEKYGDVGSVQLEGTQGERSPALQKALDDRWARIKLSGSP